MLLKTLKSQIEFRMQAGKKIPNDDLLAGFILEAMYYIVGKCIPIRLIVSSDTENTLRVINKEYSIIAPTLPVFTLDAELNFDEDLTFAVINYVIFLISGEADKKILCDEIIFDHIAKESDYGYNFS